MTCKDFQHRWDELLDVDAGVVSRPGATAVVPEIDLAVDEAEALLLAHAADCPVCRPIAAQYQSLRLAIRAWRQPPAPPADLIQRILSVSDEPPAGRRRAAGPARQSWQAQYAGLRRLSRGRLAASLLLFMMLAFVLYPIERGRKMGRANQAAPIVAGDRHSISGPRPASGGPAPFGRALAEASSATWDLARSASEPAARIGREVLDATAQTQDPAVAPPANSPLPAALGPAEGLAGLSVTMPSLAPLESDAMEASALIQQVGDHLSAGVQPLSNTARHAFRFLLGPPPAPAGSTPGGSSSSGARSG